MVDCHWPQHGRQNVDQAGEGPWLGAAGDVHRRRGVEDPEPGPLQRAAYLQAPWKRAFLSAVLLHGGSPAPWERSLRSIRLQNVSTAGESSGGILWTPVE